MSEGLMKMWLALGAIGFMFFAVSFILLSRHRIKNKFLKGITALVAYTPYDCVRNCYFSCCI
ncbi:DUF2768 domain-containing protein [Bacillus cereus]